MLRAHLYFINTCNYKCTLRLNTLDVKIAITQDHGLPFNESPCLHAWAYHTY